jgi:hypothetical protein
LANEGADPSARQNGHANDGCSGSCADAAWVGEPVRADAACASSDNRLKPRKTDQALSTGKEPTHDDPTPPPQLPAIWASQIGRAAAAMPNHPQMPGSLPPPSRLAAILDHFNRRAERMDHARKKLNAEDLLRD